MSYMMNAYLNNESHYNRFVYAHFLDMPEDMRALMAELLGAYTHGENTHMDYAQAKQRILEWLNENVAYSESISPRASDTDFLADFLSQSKAGYDVHYAAAATMMMRYFGIPARYVEGYLITPDTAATAQPNTPFTLSEADAHAWTEIYQDGVGWIPFETAPGYLNLMPQQDRLSGTGKTQNQPQVHAQDDAPLPENSLDMTEDFHEEPDDQDASQPETFPAMAVPAVSGCADAVDLPCADAGAWNKLRAKAPPILHRRSQGGCIESVRLPV